MRRLNPDTAADVMRRAGVQPNEPYPGSASPWRCRCTRCGRDVSPSYKGVRQGQGACVYCARVAIDPADAVAFMRTSALEPLVAYPGASERWLCRCVTCGHTLTPRYDNVKAGCGGCAPCGRVESGAKRRHPSAAAEGALRASGLEPLEPYPGVTKRWTCQCKSCGASTFRTLNDQVGSRPVPQVLRVGAS